MLCSLVCGAVERIDLLGNIPVQRALLVVGKTDCGLVIGTHVHGFFGAVVHPHHIVVAFLFVEDTVLTEHHQPVHFRIFLFIGERLLVGGDGLLEAVLCAVMRSIIEQTDLTGTSQLWLSLTDSAVRTGQNGGMFLDGDRVKADAAW